MAGPHANNDHRLQQKHRLLHDEISRLARRAILTPKEQQLVVELKKEKLRTKDLLSGIRRNGSP